MNDLEFLERLKRELLHGPAWRDIRGVAGMADDPALAENELRVYPAQNESSGQASVFRLIVEWEVASGPPLPDRWTLPAA
jgi:hypothetical protein